MMRVQMMVTKAIASPPRGRVVYPRGAMVNVDDETAQRWMQEQPAAARDADAPQPREESHVETQSVGGDPWQEP